MQLCMHFSCEYSTIDIMVYMYIVVIIFECAQRAERKMCELEKSKPVTVSAS